MSKLRQFDVIYEPVLASRAMRDLDRLLRVVAHRDVTVTFIGESGSGKEVLARRVHELSTRRAQPFIPINCAAIPEALFESELFGHERGAFTGAHDTAQGKIEAAAGGTLFLDEIGEMPVQMQTKLLRFLESRKFMRVGGTRKIAVDVRLVCATLRPLDEEVRRGRFRADLLYRIQGVTLVVPPLRERGPDLLPLIRQILPQLTARHQLEPPQLPRKVLGALRRHDWPGNVRELRNVLELLCLLRAGKSVRLRDLPPAIAALEVRRDAEVHTSERLEVRLDRPLDETIDAIIRAAVRLEGGNRSRAAQRLGIGLRTVQRRLGPTADA